MRARGLLGPGEVAKMPDGEDHDSKERVGPASLATGRSGGPVKVALIVHTPPLWQQISVALLRSLESILNTFFQGFASSAHRDVETVEEER